MYFQRFIKKNILVLQSLMLWKGVLEDFSEKDEERYCQLLIGV